MSELFHAEKAGIEEIPVIQDIHTKVYEAVEDGARLDMVDWYATSDDCDATCCRGGWAILLAGEAGRVMEETFPNVFAASLIYAASDPHLEAIPDFYCSNEEALMDIKEQYLIEQARYGVYPEVTGG